MFKNSWISYSAVFNAGNRKGARDPREMLYTGNNVLYKMLCDIKYGVFEDGSIHAAIANKISYLINSNA